MSREISIYCDESDISGKHFSNFYGGALVESHNLEEVISRLESKKVQLNLGAEVKWQKISENYADKYISFLDEVFNLLDEGKMKFRVMFTQNYFQAVGLTKEQREKEFFLLYYQFVKHAFGLSYCGSYPEQTKVRMYFDKLPDKDEKCEEFKDFVVRLNYDPAFRAAGLIIKKDQIAEVDSKKHVILQSLDIVMGAMQFRLNDKHLEKPEGSWKRGKRTIAKEKVYKYVQQRVAKLHKGFNIGISTGVRGVIENRWLYAYSHWKFQAAEVKIMPQYAKHK